MTIYEWWKSIKEQDRADIVVNLVGVWVDGGITKCFAHLSQEQKDRAFAAFKKDNEKA